MHVDFAAPLGSIQHVERGTRVHRHQFRGYLSAVRQPLHFIGIDRHAIKRWNTRDPNRSIQVFMPDAVDALGDHKYFMPAVRQAVGLHIGLCPNAALGSLWRILSGYESDPHGSLPPAATRAPN